jgi:hypothetical protein
MLFMAIASHKLISGLALSSRFLKEGATTRQVWIGVMDKPALAHVTMTARRRKAMMTKSCCAGTLT